MARLYQTGFEENTVTSEGFVISGSNPPTISTVQARTGTYALRQQGGTGSSMDYQFASADGNGAFWVKFNIFIATLPSANTAIIYTSNIGNTANQTAIRLSTTGTLKLIDPAGAQVGSDSATLALNTWYSVTLYFLNGATLALSAYLGKTLFASTTSNTGIGAIGMFHFGNGDGAVTMDVYFDDVVINDSTGSNQNGLPENEKIIHVRPSAAGDVNGFTVGVGGTAGQANNFTRVQEVSPDDATTYNGSAVLNAEDLFNVDDITLADTNGVLKINVVAVGIRMADLVGADATAAFKVEIEKTGSGTKSQSGTLIPNSTSFLTNAASAPRNYPLVAYADPDGAKWTPQTINSMQIGYIQTVTNVQTIAVSTVWASIGYLIVNSIPGNSYRYGSVGNGESRSEGWT